MDLSKAFDCLYDLLIVELHACGLSETTYETMFDYPLKMLEL